MRVHGPGRAQQPDPGGQHVRQEARQWVVAGFRAGLVEAIDHDDQVVRRVELPRDPPEQLEQPALGLDLGVAQPGERDLDLCCQ